jgi:hypothetical protein
VILIPRTSARKPGGDGSTRNIPAMRIAVSRSPNAERVVTPLELFFDLVYVFDRARTTCSSTSICGRAPRP